MPRNSSSELLALLWTEMQRGLVYEADVRDKKFHLDGLCDGRRVYVNPAPGVVEALLHELLHRAKPRFSERRVLAESKRLLSKMSEAEVRKWYRAFQRTAKKPVRPVRLDE